jgi:hypothetical protein
MSSIFEEAQDTVYGDPSKNLHVIANLWEMYLYRRGLMGDDSNNLRPDDDSFKAGKAHQSAWT